jgi:hypothetical protein
MSVLLDVVQPLVLILLMFLYTENETQREKFIQQSDEIDCLTAKLHTMQEFPGCFVGTE